jgi:tetratricopeptide (TPR) repeat protein
MSMPVPVRAVFEDGTTQDGRADRTQAVTELSFRSRSPLREVVIDPEKKLAMIDAPVAKISSSAAAKLAFGLNDRDAPDVYAALKDEPVATAEIWYRLGLGLFGAGRHDEAADCFARIGGLKTDPLWKFGALGWLGILEDLKGHRADALAHYKAALAIVPDRPLRHDQFKITMDRAWIEERLAAPFRRDKK